MKTRRYFIKQLTPAEVGITGTHEFYIRCPNDFDHNAFFQQEAQPNDTVLQIVFNVTVFAYGGSPSKECSLRYVYYFNSPSHEKRIPSLRILYSEFGVQANDYVKIESITSGGVTTLNMYFFKPEDFATSTSQYVYSENIEDSIPEPDSDYSEYISLLTKNNNLILTGAPGTGKTFHAKQLAAKMVGNCRWSDLSEDQKKQISFVQFHPSYDYTDFVEGLRPDGSGNFIRTDGAFKGFCKRAITEAIDSTDNASEAKYVFIIDEINRGELSKIFGELFFSIDPGYRGEDGTVLTQYQNLVPKGDVFAKGFYVPKNVYIIGTMNDIDRGVEAMDFAIRRRFAWREITAEDSASSMGISGLARKKMDALNQALLDRDLSSAFFIGGAYFRKVEGNDFDGLWKYHLKGIVSEYFRGNPEAGESIEYVYNAYTNAGAAAPTTVEPETEEPEEAN